MSFYYHITMYSYEAFRRSYKSATDKWLNMTLSDVEHPQFYTQHSSQTMSVQASHSRGLDTLLLLQATARDYETKLGITSRWTQDSPEWTRANKTKVERGYDVALDKVESLVVARVFELSKMNHAGTGDYSHYFRTFRY